MERKRLMEYLSIRASLRQRCCDSQGCSSRTASRGPTLSNRSQRRRRRERTGPRNLCKGGARATACGPRRSSPRCCRGPPGSTALADRRTAPRRAAARVVVAGRGGHELQNTAAFTLADPADAIDAAGLGQARKRFALLSRDVSQLSDDQLRNLVVELENPRIAPAKLISGLSPSATRSAEGLALGPEQRAAAIETGLASVPSAVTLFAKRAAA
jgi:hypothetical protein